jgi:hypothetical protein
MMGEIGRFTQLLFVECVNIDTVKNIRLYFDTYVQIDTVIYT